MYKFTWNEFGKKEEFVSNNEYDIKEMVYFVTKNSLSVDKIWSECKKLKKGDSTSIHVNLLGYIGCERIDQQVKSQIKYKNLSKFNLNFERFIIISFNKYVLCYNIEISET